LKNKLKVLVSGEEVIINELFIDRRPGAKAGNETHQMCRSASTWSIGVRDGNTEQSIHNAYQELIDESEQFIYIENQFFMGLENKIVDKLAARISRAHAQRQPFKVVIVMPLLPGFEGDITDPNSTVLRIQMHHQYQSIRRGEHGLYKKLAHIPNIDDYIFFFGLRQSAVIDGVPMT
jgi:phospholipase D1/2